MPPDPHDTFAITVTTTPERQRTDLVLTGDVDMAALPLLADAVDQIGQASPRTVVVDLAGVTFGGSTLVNFLARSPYRRDRIPAGDLPTDTDRLDRAAHDEHGKDRDHSR